jgi:DNA-binding FrmR family transcriptional regulator
MGHTITDKKPLLARVRRIKGQTEALERALEAGTECMAVLQQISAIRGAVNGLMSQVLEGHLREHMAPAGDASRDRAEDVDAIVSVLRSYLK